ncbi:uncharacterized protein LOC105766206 [Gossypium raimondii]|uniref:uncharacterized protein LOC105766206 n=1 Tax=Gossypium raimondii TaxID=29730 RepID=UPI00227BBBA1|nr:uncharacterized protein LOC105766206 [Gossypium raimondii]
MPDSNKNQALENIKDCERVGTTSRQKQKFTHTARSKSFTCVADDEELSFGQKLGRLQLFDITHRKKDGSPMTTEVVEIMQYMSSANQAQAEVQRLRDQMTQMQASTVEQIAQLKAEEALREAEAQRKYDELQLQLKAEAVAREVEASKKYDELQLQLQNMMKMFQ